MPANVALDTNILVYASRIGKSEADLAKSRRTDEFILEYSADRANIFVAAQALIELHDVLCRKGGYSKEAAALEIDGWQQGLAVIPTSATVLSAAIELSTHHQLRIFDAVILSAAAEAGCDRLLTEDLHTGFVWRGVEVVNPFD